jgi:aminobenzoyl-glutamate utilization protein B
MLMADIDFIDQRIEQRVRDYTTLSDRLWDDPELRWEERRAVAAQTALAEREGFRVAREIGGVPTAFTAEFGAGGPVIALLGEFDALANLSQASGVAAPEPDAEHGSTSGHGCGHHLLGTGSLLAAAVVKDYLAAHRLPGTVRYYGCPAEEGAAGKTYLVKAGAFSDVDCAVTWHPGNLTGVNRVLPLAYCQAYVTFSGVAAHAGKAPHLGRSALDALELMNVGVNFLREHMPPDSRVHYAILDAGGPSANVVQAHARAYYIVRAVDVPQMRSLFDRVCKIAEGAALMTGTTVDIDYDGGCSSMLPNDVLEAAIDKNLGAWGGVAFSAADHARAKPFAETLDDDQLGAARRQSRMTATDDGWLHSGVASFDPDRERARVGWSSDVGDVSWVVPTAQCEVACAAIGTPTHSWQLVAQGKLPAAHKGMAFAARVMAATVIDLYVDAELRRLAQAEFARRTLETPYDCPLPPNLLPPPLRSTGSTRG